MSRSNRNFFSGGAYRPVRHLSTNWRRPDPTGLSSPADSGCNAPTSTAAPGQRNDAHPPGPRGDPLGNPYTEVCCCVCNNVVANIYTDDGGPWMGDSAEYTAPNGRVYTSFLDGVNGDELGRVYADAGDDPCSWHGGTTPRGGLQGFPMSSLPGGLPTLHSSEPSPHAALQGARDGFHGGIPSAPANRSDPPPEAPN